MAAETVAAVGSTAQRVAVAVTPAMATATAEVQEERVGADWEVAVWMVARADWVVRAAEAAAAVGVGRDTQECSSIPNARLGWWCSTKAACRCPGFGRRC